MTPDANRLGESFGTGPGAEGLSLLAEFEQVQVFVETDPSEPGLTNIAAATELEDPAANLIPLAPHRVAKIEDDNFRFGEAA
jgi:hypothetical protein